MSDDEEFYYFDHSSRIGDLASALHCNGGDEWIKRIERVVLELTGENDGPEWHWIVKLTDGRYAYVAGGCDYTGWDCSSHCDVHEADTLDGALALAPQDERRVFEEMVERDEPRRDTKQLDLPYEKLRAAELIEQLRNVEELTRTKHAFAKVRTDEHKAALAKEPVEVIVEYERILESWR